MTYYVGGMNYARYRLRPPKLCVQDENAPSVRDGATSVASSRPSSAYRAVEEAAAERTAVLEAETVAKRQLPRLAETRAVCGEQHRAVALEIEAVQCSVKDSRRATNQQQTVQSAKVDAMGYRLHEMKWLLLQRELRMEVQVTELKTGSMR